MGFRRAQPSRGNASPLGFEAFDFSGLLNINAMPQTVADNQLTIAQNVYGDVDGGLQMRRGMANRGTLFSGSVPGQGIVRFYQQVVGGFPVSTIVKFTLGQSGGTLWNVDTHTQIGATNALGSLAQPWTTARIYDPSISGGTDILVICTGDGGPYFFDGINISTHSAWTATAAGARWCQVSNGTLWFAGMKTAPNTLVQMQLGSPSTFGQLYTTSHPVTGLSVLGAGSQSGLFFGMTQGVGITFGVNSVDSYYQEIPHEDGVAAGRTCIAVNGLVYFLGNFNIYVFDGQNITPIGDNVRPWIVCDPNRNDYPMNGNRAATSFSWYYNDYIYFAYDANNVGVANTYLVWHMKQRGWTILTGPTLSGASLMNAPGDAYPIGCVVIDAKKSQAYNWDVYNGSGPNSHGVDDAGAIITTNILTKYFPLSGHGTKSRLTGITPELFVEQFGGSMLVATDYGATSVSDVLSVIAQTDALVWDVSKWDQSIWGSGAILNFFVTPLQVDDTMGGQNISYTFAFGITTDDKNPPYRFAGVSGEYSIEGRSYSA